MKPGTSSGVESVGGGLRKSSHTASAPDGLFFVKRAVPYPEMEWNNRFHVMTTKDNKKLHCFYKVSYQTSIYP